MKKLLFILLFPLAAFGQLQLPFSIQVINPKPVDAYYYNTSGVPYTNTAQVISQVVSAVRYQGQTFNVAGSEYWFAAGITNGDLVAKGGGGGGATSGSGTTVVGTNVDLGGNLTHRAEINQNGYDFKINGVIGNMFTKWDYAKGELIITDDTTSIYSNHVNTTNIIYGNADSLGSPGNGSMGYSFVGGYGNALSPYPGGSFDGAFSNFIYGQENHFQEGLANVTFGAGNYSWGSGFAYHQGNLLGGLQSRMYDCYGCFVMGSGNYQVLSGATYKPVSVGNTGFGNSTVGAFNFSHNTNAQGVGNGVHSDFSSILGGSDHNIATGARGSGIFGGRQIHLSSGDSNIVSFPRVRIFQGLNAGKVYNDTLAHVLAVDAGGNIKIRHASSLGGGGGGTVTSVGISSSDLNISGSPITTSGSITANVKTDILDGGRYTPTVSGISGASSLTVQSFTWSRVRDIVTVHGTINIGTKGSNGTISFTIDNSPVTSAFTSQWDANGTVTWHPVAQAGSIWAISSSSSFQVQVVGALAGSGDLTISCQYEIK